MSIDTLRASLSDRYTIERELGQGGMATVYLAHDRKHDRQVAIKVLRPELAAVIGAERFLAEIRTTANLQHPHILALIDSGDTDGILWYVMPYVEGESLRDRLTHEKQLPVADAVRIATEVAGALDYAHRHGVIHRDIKPENILLHDGSALVADFGIALAVSGGGSTRMTETGMSLGTPHYMSPEQAMGEREITGRSDVYALGAITYEMLVGEPPFTGPTAQAIIARVMSEEPRGLTTQRKSVPPGVEAAVFTALEKLPADRYATAAEFAAALKDPTATSYRTAATPAAAGFGRRGWLVTGAVGALMLVFGWAAGRSRGSAAAADAGVGVVRASVSLGDSTVLDQVTNLRVALSPDGRRLAFAGRQGGRVGIFIRELRGDASTFLTGTEEGFAPFFSPDGTELGFFVGPGGGADLRVIPVAGGVARTVVSDSASGYGGAWGDDGNIYYGSTTTSGMVRVPAVGGASTPVALPDTAAGISELDFPDILPGSRFATVMMWKGSPGASTIGLVNLATGVSTELAQGAMARYLDPGVLVIGTTRGELLAGHFDLKSGRLLGEPTPVLKNVERESQNGSVQFAVSRTGTLVYQPASGRGDRLGWVDRQGKMVEVDSLLSGYIRTPQLSPDGRRIAMTYIGPGGDQQVWVKNLVTGSMTKVSTDVLDADRPAWEPGGARLAYLASKGTRREPYSRRADASDAPRLVLPGGEQADEIAFDPSGKFVLTRTRGGGEGTRWLKIFEPGVDSTLRDLLPKRKFDQFAPAISPDGHWLAYASSETGIQQVFVRPFPDVDSARYAISIGGGSEPVWRRDGKELYFRGSHGEMFAVPTTLNPTFVPGAPTMLFPSLGYVSEGFHTSYDVNPDGRFLMVETSGGGTTALGLILNWRTELEAVGTTKR